MTMSLDLGPATVGVAARGGGADAASTPRRPARVMAVVRATRPDHLVAVMAGVAAQSRQPDLVVAVDCVGPATALEAGPAPQSPSPGSGQIESGQIESAHSESAHSESGQIASGHTDVSSETPSADTDLAATGSTETGPTTTGPSDSRLPSTHTAEAPLTQAPSPEPDHDDFPTAGYLPFVDDQTDESTADETAGESTTGQFGDSFGLLLGPDGEPVVDQSDTQVVQVAAQPDAATVLAAHCDTVLAGRVGLGQTAAVGAALSWLDDAAADLPQAAADVEDWLWLLDDSDRPSMKALARMLAAARQSSSVAILGAKHRGGPTGCDLLDVGLTTTRSGRWLRQVDHAEPDQGQRDHISDVLAVPLSGMLIRRDVWESLRGLDPALETPARRTDAAIDLCRRARLAGHRVEVVPTAVLTAPVGAPAEIEDRAGRTHRRLAGAPLLALPFVTLGIVVGALARVLAGIATKEPVRALRAGAQVMSAVLRPDRVLRARWRTMRTRAVPRRRLTGLLATPRETLRWHRDRLQHSRPRLTSPAGTDAGPGRLRAPAILAGLLVGIGGLALYRVVGEAPFSSPAAAPVSHATLDTWRAAGSSWVSEGLGQPGPADPLLFVLALIGAPVTSPRTAVLIALIAGPALAALSAWWAAGALTRSRPLRIVAAICWSTTPVLLLAVSSGRIGLVLAALALPLHARAVGQALATSTRRSVWAWSAAAALALIPVTTGVPALLLPALLALVVVVVRGRATLRAPLLAAGLPALALGLPALIAGSRWPGLLLADPGHTSAVTAPPGWAGLLGWPLPAGEVFDPHGRQIAHHLLDQLIGAGSVSLLATVLPWTVGALVPLLALLSLRSVGRGSPRAAATRAGWLIAALGVGLSYGSGYVIVDADGAHARADAGVLLTVFGLLLAAVAGNGAIRQQPSGGVRRALSRGGRILAATTLMLPLTGLVGWAAQQALAPALTDLRAGAVPPLPAVVVDAAASPDQVRTLLLEVDQAQPPGAPGTVPPVTVSVLRGEGAGVEREAAAVSVRPDSADPADQALAAAVARMLAGGEDVRPLLAQFGIGAVVVPPGGQATRGDVNDLTHRLDAALGLSQSGAVHGVRAWRVDSLSGEASAPDRPAAVRIVTDDDRGWVAVASHEGTVDADVTSPGGVVTIAERADPGWQATFNGHRLNPVTVDGWAQGFDVPAGEGRLVITHTSPRLSIVHLAALVLVSLALLLAVPVRPAERTVSR